MGRELRPPTGVVFKGNVPSACAVLVHRPGHRCFCPVLGKSGSWPELWPNLTRALSPIPRQRSGRESVVIVSSLAWYQSLGIAVLQVPAQYGLTRGQRPLRRPGDVSRGMGPGGLSSALPSKLGGLGAQVRRKPKGSLHVWQAVRAPFKDTRPPCLGDLRMVVGDSRLTGAGTGDRPSWTGSTSRYAQCSCPARVSSPTIRRLLPRPSPACTDGTEAA